MSKPIWAVIPAHDEGPRLRPVVLGSLAHLPVLVVDDGSTDDTADIAEGAGARVVRQRPNQGKGVALRTGFRTALDDDVRAVVTLDADGQHDPAEDPAFLEAFAARGADLVIGRRDFRKMPMSRRVANELGTWTFSRAVGRPIPDNQSGYRLISRRLLDRLLGSTEQGFEFEVEMITTAIRAGYRLDWVPISTIYAGEPSHIRPISHVSSFLRVARDARRTVRQPLD